MQPVVKAACVHSLSRIVQIRTMTVYLSSLGDVFFFFARSLSLIYENALNALHSQFRIYSNDISFERCASQQCALESIFVAVYNSRYYIDYSSIVLSIARSLARYRSLFTSLYNFVELHFQLNHQFPKLRIEFAICKLEKF